MRPPGLEPHAEQRVARPAARATSKCVTAVARRVGVEREARRVAPVAPDRRLDPAAARARPARDERQVRRARARGGARAPAAAGAPPRERATTSRPEVSRSSRWTIPGRLGLLAARDARARAGVDERAGRVPRRPGGRRGRRACRRRAGARPRRRSAAASASAPACGAAASGGSSSSSSPAREPVALRPRARRRPARRRSTSARSAAAREPSSGAREEAVEPLARGLVRNAHGRSVCTRRRRRRGAGRRSASSSAPSRIADADHDEAVGEVERGPPARSRGSRSRGRGGRGRRGSRRCRRSARPSATGSTGWRAPERAKNTSIQRDRDRGQPIDERGRRAKKPERDPRVLDVVDRERPDTCVASSSASWLATMCFVSWSATTAATATAASPIHCRRPAASERSATEIGVNASVSSRRDVDARARLAQRAPACACPRCRGSPTGSASSRSASIGLPQRSQQAVGAVVDACERRVDRGRATPGVLLERLVDLAVDGRSPWSARWLSALGRVDLVVGARRRALVVQVLDRADDPLALLQEQRAELLGVDVDASCASFPAVTASRSASSGSRPVSSTTLSRAPWPETSVRTSRGSASARRAGGRRRRWRVRPRAALRRAPSRPRRSGRRSRSARTGRDTQPQTRRRSSAKYRPATLPRHLGRSSASSRGSTTTVGAPSATTAARRCASAACSSVRTRRPRSQVLALAAGAARDRPRLGVGLGDDQVRPRAWRCSPARRRGALGRDERRAQQLLEPRGGARARLELLDPVGEVHRAPARRPRSCRRPPRAAAVDGPRR